MWVRRIEAWAAAAVLAAASPAAAEVVARSDAGFALSGAGDVAGRTPAQVWDALILPSRWWSGAHSLSGDAGNLTLDARAGGCFCERLPATAGTGSVANGSVEHGRVILAEPGHMLRMQAAFGPLQGEGMAGTLTITLTPSMAGATAGATTPTTGQAGTHIAWEYVAGGFMRFKTEMIAPALDHVLSEQIGRLASYAATGHAAPPTH